MEKINVELENCYGIRHLKQSFDFTAAPTYAIYAPNGVMKTSFAKAFRDLSQGDDSSDLIYKDRKTKRIVTDGDNKDITREHVFVVEPYNNLYVSSKITTLLVNKELKDRYDEIHLGIDNKKDVLIKALKPLSGLNKNLEETISETFTHGPNDFFKSIMRVKDEVLEKGEPEFPDIIYKQIFNEKALGFLKTKDFKTKIAHYIEIFDDLIESSRYFKKGVFNHNNAAIIAKNLKDNGFFKAKHSVSLHAQGDRLEITTEAQLEEVIQEEKEKILNNPDLVKAFEEIDAKLKTNVDLRSFRDYLLNNQSILPELPNLERFSQKLWISYFKQSLVFYEDLQQEYSSGRKEIEKIVEKATDEKTRWIEVIGIFNSRFAVPFRLTLDNQEDVILKRETPNIEFTFADTEDDQRSVDKEDLLRVLSSGESRALYILNIIFEVEARRDANVETLFIVDDIADSFDYKNKYAIIEYLKDISNEPLFNQIILTHNFDFFRTVTNRLDMPRENKLNTIKTASGINLVPVKYQRNPFSHWRNNLHTDNSMLIASIPFVRNLAEYTGDFESYNKLTSLLHMKKDSDNIRIIELQKIHKKVLRDKNSLTLPNPDEKVLDLIFDTADAILASSKDFIELEQKVSLAMAIRLKAEKYMIISIDDEDYCNGITKNQTAKLSEEFLRRHLEDENARGIINKVVLMTPESIHLNSFMYEPILDMSNWYLKRLYTEVSSLYSSIGIKAKT